MAGDDTVSIIIPTYYRNDLLRDAIESALDQTHDPVEVVVVDDSGEGHAEPVADEYEEISYIPLPENRGENPARDAALDVATGQYVQFLDDDDLLREDKIRLQKPLLDESTGVVYSGLKYHESGEVIRPDPTARGDVLKRALRFQMWPPCFTSSLLIDRDVIEQIRPLEYHGAGDTTFMIGLAQRTQFDFVDAPLVEKRLEVNSLGYTLQNVQNKKQLFDEYAALYAQFPDCYRSAKEHVYRQEGHVRLSRRRWSPLAVVAFARAAYHTSENRFECLCETVGAVGGRPGIQTTTLGHQFVKTCQNDGFQRALGQTVEYLQSRAT